MPSLQIYLLGDMRVLWGENPLPPFSTRHTRSLFAYLVTHRQRMHSRAHLAGTFWTDFPESRAHRNLNTTLWRLRHVLPENYLLSQDDSIAFNTASDFWLDVAEFESRCATSQADRVRTLEEAIRLYRGDFLEGWYEDWALVEAERLRLLYVRALHDLTDCYQAAGAFTQALDCARRLLEIDSLREDVHRQIMELHAALGQRQAALAQFAECERLLKNEMGIAPDRETVALYQKIRSKTWIASPVVAARSVERARPTLAAMLRTPFEDFGQVSLVGRESELAVLQSHLERLGNKSGGMILLKGESGVGKTRLAREVMRLASSLRVSTLWGRCPDMQSPPPYQGLVEALRSGIPLLKREGALPIASIWLSELTALLPELTDELAVSTSRLTSMSYQDQSRLLEAIAQYLTGLARLGSIVVVLEDLQWADSATCEALRFLLPRLRNLPMLMIATLRPEEVSDREELSQTLVALESAGLAQPLVVKRLSFAETATLARRFLGLTEDHPALSSFIYRETEGNPFFVEETIKSLVEEGYLWQQMDGDWDTLWDRIKSKDSDWGAPRGIRRALERRLSVLASASRSVLEMAAVLGHDFDFDLLRDACGKGEEVVLEATDDLLRRQLLSEEQGHLVFNHEKIRQVVYSSVSSPRRRALHRQAGQVLAHLAPQQIEQLANHFYLAQDFTRAPSYCLQAGDRAKSLYANQTALSYYDWAIQSARQVEGVEAKPVLVNALEQRGKVYEHVGNYDAALTDYDAVRASAEAIGDRATAARAVRRVAWVQGEHLGDWESGLNGARKAWELAKETGSPREAAIALLDMGYFYNMRAEYPRALEALRRALDIASDLGDAGARAASLQYLVATLQPLGRYEEAMAACEEARVIWEQRGNRRAEGLTLVDMGYLHLSLGEIDLAEQAFRRSEVILREIEAHATLVPALIGLSVLQRYRNQCRDSLNTLKMAEDLEQQTRRNPYDQALIHYHRGMAHWHLGEEGAAFTDLREALTLARQSKTPTLAVSVSNDLGRCLRQNGDVSSAMTLHEESHALAQQISFLDGEISAQGEFALDQLIAAQFSQSESIACLEDASLQAPKLSKPKRAEILMNYAEGLLIARQPDRALAAAQECVALTNAIGLKEFGGWCHLLLGRALIALGRLAEAEIALRQGIACLDPMGHSQTRACLLDALALVGQDAILPHPALQPGKLRVKLARRGAPSGRPLREDEQVIVNWTVDAGTQDEALFRREGKVALRHARILRLLQEADTHDGDPTQDDLARALQVTPRTIRSDISFLRQKGHALRTRGQ